MVVGSGGDEIKYRVVCGMVVLWLCIRTMGLWGDSNNADSLGHIGVTLGFLGMGSKCSFLFFQNSPDDKVAAKVEKHLAYGKRNRKSLTGEDRRGRREWAMGTKRVSSLKEKSEYPLLQSLQSLLEMTLFHKLPICWIFPVFNLEGAPLYLYSNSSRYPGSCLLLGCQSTYVPYIKTWLKAPTPNIWLILPDPEDSSLGSPSHIQLFVRDGSALGQCLEPWAWTLKI